MNHKQCLPLFMLVALHMAIAFAEEAVIETPISESDREHWAFQPIKQPACPTVRQTSWVRNGLDTFILAKLEKNGVTPSPEAARGTLLRRLSFDLIGLPPTPEELARFEHNTAIDAYECEVERLLESPAYGERWAQHWLDLARFAETDGFEHDKVRPDAWKYRDWVIAALNRDLPYDQFVRQQIAGDLLPQTADPVPTMFCLAGPDMPDMNDQHERRHLLMNELTGTVGSVLLGLQMGCAQCHDHKYDPLSQADFYRLRALFEPAVSSLKREVPYSLLRQHSEPIQTRMWVRGDHRRPGAEVAANFPRILSENKAEQGELITRTRLDFVDWLFCEEQSLAARVMVNRIWQHHFGSGLSHTPSDFGLMGSEPTHPELLDWLAVEFRTQGWSLKRLHRTIVCSATYRQTSRANGEDESWQSRLAADPENELYGRASRRRLEGETLRDAMLASAGLLAFDRGGPGVMPPLAEEVLNTLLKEQWTTSKRAEDHYRRSIYIFARRNLRYPLFDAFDRPTADASCPARNRSTTATQSLVLLNSEFSLLAARHLAGCAIAESTEPAHQIEYIYLRCFSRPPTAAEIATASHFLAKQRERLASETRPREKLALPPNLPESFDRYTAAALVDACLAMLNISEFLFID